jgi:hypothetical protein
LRNHCAQRRLWTTIAAAASALVVLAMAGCLSSEHVLVKRRASISPSRPPGSTTSSRPPVCTGEAGRPLLQAFFDDLGNGRKDLLAKYFVQPRDFIRWFDPKSGYITFLPGPGNDNPTLDALQAALDSLQRHGAAAVLTNFHDSGYEGNNADELGGGFTFQIRGRADRRNPMTQGDGNGLIDCATGKLRVFFLFAW